ncbi:SAM-dependent methyltransferase [Streptomyces violaceus]|uniref:N-6 DNA methylase n=1 Tax=Streptomyces violaceus TaxID=1936 RepID=UPI002E1C7BFC|nr:N-6 DNA methylase [Streptomyces violaceus]
MTTRVTDGTERSALVSLGEIKELAEVGRPTVSNWRRRFARDVLESAGDRRPPFPDAVAGSESRPLFDAEEMASWLDLRPIPDAEPDEDGTAPTYGDRFRRGLRLRGMVALRHELGSANQLIIDALAVCAMEGEGGDWYREALPEQLAEDADKADPRVADAIRELIEELGSPGSAADTVLSLAERLESDLTTDTTAPAVAELISALVGPSGVLAAGPGQPSVINLCAGTGELLFARDDIGGRGDIVAVEPDPLRRKLLLYRLFAHHCSTVDICVRPEDLDTLRPWEQREFDLDPDRPWGMPSADLVLADPPYASGERDADEEGPLGWALEAVRRLKPDGRGYVVVPSWTLTRPRGSTPTPSVRMREELLNRDAVAAVVQLPRRIHPFRTGAEHSLLVLRGEAAMEEQGKVLLVDADRIAHRVGGAWMRYVAEVLYTGRSPVNEEAAFRPVWPAGPRAEALLDGRSVLPAHRLAAKEQGLDHFAATLDARREAAVALPRLKEWIGDLGVARRQPEVRVAHRRVGEHLKAGQLRLLAGHRIREADLGDAGLPVVGREEMLGALPVGGRRIALEDLAQYPQAVVTERGDVFMLTEHGIRTYVDDAGGCVLLAPVQGLRIAAYRPYLAGEVLPETLWMRPQPLAQLLAAPRNQQRSSGSLVRRVSVRDMDLPELPPEEVAELEAILSETERQRAQVRRQLEALDNLALRLAAGVADGDLALRRRAGST